MGAVAAGKKQKKKWSKGKVKDKSQHAVIAEKAVEEKIRKEAQTARILTVAVLVDRANINGSLARRFLKQLESEGAIKAVVRHHTGNIYVRVVSGEA